VGFPIDLRKDRLVNFSRKDCGAMSKANFDPEVKKAVDSILLKNPSIVSGKMYGYPAYYINRKLVACIYEQGVGLKVPESVANELIGKKGIVHFQPMGRAKMREWIQIIRENPEDLLKETEIFKTSIDFVAPLAKK
jgi:hypothetical protein